MVAINESYLNYQQIGSDYSLKHTPPLYANVLRHGKTHLVMPTDQGGGILNGDVLNHNIYLNQQAKLRWQPAASSYFLPGSSQRRAELQFHLSVQGGSELTFISPSNILHAGSRLCQNYLIEIDQESNLFFWDSAVAGRLAHKNEAFQFASFENRLCLKFADREVYNDHMLLRPDRMGQSHACFANFTCWGSGVAVGTAALERLTNFAKENCLGFEISINQISDKVYLLRALGQRHIGFRY